MQILFEDADIIVCQKPVGVLSQADDAGKESMITLLEAHTGGAIFPLHRLDREVGGVMVYAKTKRAAASLSRDIAEHKFEKDYLALVHGTPNVPSGELRDLLFKDSRKNKSFVVARPRRGVKEAVLTYEQIQTAVIDGDTYTLVRVTLQTGRTHQIRVQFSSRKMPLAGDKKYGGRDSFDTIMLWSHRIGFRHPVSGEHLTFSVDPVWSV